MVDDTGAVLGSEVEREWKYWEMETRKIRLCNGVRVVVQPGDQLLVDIDIASKEVLRIIDFRARTLH